MVYLQPINLQRKLFVALFKKNTTVSRMFCQFMCLETYVYTLSSGPTHMFLECIDPTLNAITDPPPAVSNILWECVCVWGGGVQLT